jgi:ABC-type branched-subunit amino acid transport system ATPase component
MKYIIETKKLIKHFGGVNAVDNLSVNITEGKITGLVGPNGSGKTTLIDLLSGLLSHDSGEIVFSGIERRKVMPSENKVYGITRTFQQVRLFEQMSVLDNILVVLTERHPLYSLFERHSEYHIGQAEDVLRKIGLYDKKSYHAMDLSFGQRKLLEIGRGLAMNTEVILLDEPFAGLFPEIVKKIEGIIRGLKQEGKTVVLVEHNIAIIRSLCDHLIVMDAGKLLAQGRPDEVLSKRDVLEAYLGE